MDVFIEMLPILQAEESLTAIHNAQIGAGLLETSDVNRAINSLLEAAGHHTEPIRPSRADLEAIGIGVTPA